MDVSSNFSIIMTLVIFSVTGVTTIQQGRYIHGVEKNMGWEKLGDFREKSPFISQTVPDRSVVTYMDHK